MSRSAFLDGVAHPDTIQPTSLSLEPTLEDDSKSTRLDLKRFFHSGSLADISISTAHPAERIHPGIAIDYLKEYFEAEEQKLSPAIRYTRKKLDSLKMSASKSSGNPYVAVCSTDCLSLSLALTSQNPNRSIAILNPADINSVLGQFFNGATQTTEETLALCTDLPVNLLAYIQQSRIDTSTGEEKSEPKDIPYGFDLEGSRLFSHEDILISRNDIMRDPLTKELLPFERRGRATILTVAPLTQISPDQYSFHSAKQTKILNEKQADAHYTKMIESQFRVALHEKCSDLIVNDWGYDNDEQAAFIASAYRKIITKPEFFGKINLWFSIPPLPRSSLTNNDSTFDIFVSEFYSSQRRNCMHPVHKYLLGFLFVGASSGAIIGTVIYNSVVHPALVLSVLTCGGAFVGMMAFLICISIAHRNQYSCMGYTPRLFNFPTRIGEVIANSKKLLSGAAISTKPKELLPAPVKSIFVPDKNLKM